MAIIKIYIVLVGMTILSSFGAYFLKRIDTSGNILNIYKDRNIYLGGFLYVSAAVLNIVILKYLPYSIVIPLTSITYIWTMFISKYFLRELITNKKIIGIILIFLGAIIVK